MFTKRTTAPSKTDKRYIHKNYGGDYLGLLGSPSYFKGSALANCTAYAFGRRQEIEKELTGNDHTLVGIPKGRKVYKPTSAYLWYGIGKSVDGYERSLNVAKIGAVMVWKNNLKLSGHVAVVEDICNDHIEFSESGMGLTGYVWRYVKAFKTYCLITNYDAKNDKYVTTKHYNYKYQNGKVLKANNTFIGYIYPPLESHREPLYKVGDMVQYRTYKRYVLAVTETEKGYKYKIGLPSTDTTKERVTGWYFETSLKKL